MWDLIVSVPDHCLSIYFTLKFLMKVGVQLDNFVVLSER